MMSDKDDQLDEFGEDIFDQEAAEQKQSVGDKLKEAWHTKPLFKFAVVMLVIGGVVAVLSGISSAEKPSDALARGVRPPDVKQAPGGPVSPYMKQQTDLADQKRAADALDNNQSALPTPQGAVMGIDELAKKYDPLNEIKAQTEKLKQQLLDMQQQQKVQQQAQAQKQAEEVRRATLLATNQAQQAQQSQSAAKQDDTLAQAMQDQMQKLATKWNKGGITVLRGAVDPNAVSAQAAAASRVSGMNMANGTQMVNDNGQPIVQKAKVRVPAGTISYSQLLTEANSDVPGPIMTHIVSGPFSGARALGQFTVQNDYLVLKFNLIHFNGKDYSVEAYAIDPNTTLTGMATEVDHRYFIRAVLPAAAAFLKGVGSALSTPDQTATTNGTSTIVTQAQQGYREGIYSGISEAANKVGSFFDKEASDTKPLIAVAAGTPMGILFTSTVFDPIDQPVNANGGYPQGYPQQYPQGYYGQAGYPNGLMGAAYSAFNGATGYSGTVVPGYGAVQANGTTASSNSSGLTGVQAGATSLYQQVVPQVTNTSR